MQIDGFGDLLKLGVKTLREPKRCLRIVLDIVITMQELLLATVFVVVLSTILSIILFMVEPADVPPAFLTLSSNPIALFMVQFATFLGLAAMVTYVGRMFKGHATFKEALTALVWLQFILFGVSIIQLIFGLILSPLYLIVFIASMMIAIHLTVNFIMEIHGFTNVLAVMAGIVGTFFGAMIILTIILTLLGFTPEVVENV